MIEVRVEVTTFGHIKTKWWSVVVACEKIVGVVDKTGLVSTGF